MNSKSRLWTIGAAVLLLAAAVVLPGCASGPARQPPDLEQRIASATTRADHESIAALFRGQAEVDRASAARHERMARAYAQGARGSSPGMAAHCEKLAQTYKQAADENLEMAKMHLQVASDMKQ